MSDPLVSVILPTYNRARVLGRAVESVLAQTWRNLELIVVDDGSTDGTPSLLASVDDPRVRVLTLEGNRGAAFARNRGIEQARGDFVSFIDSDDTWSERKLEGQVDALEASSDRAGLCVCSVVVHRARETFRNRWRDEELAGDEALSRIAHGVGYATPAWLVRRDALDRAGGFDESLPRLQDYELTLRIALEWNIRTSSDEGVTMHVQDDSLSSSADRYARALASVLERHRRVFERFPSGHSHMLFRAGKYYAMEGRRRDAQAWFARSLAVNPANLRALVGQVLCLTRLLGVFVRTKYRP